MRGKKLRVKSRVKILKGAASRLFFSIYYDMVLSMPRVFAMYYTAGFSKTLLIIHIKLHCFLLPRCVRQHCPLS